jgi:prepilin-type N-terminal cleavage/methylation domain-containing protein
LVNTWSAAHAPAITARLRRPPATGDNRRACGDKFRRYGVRRRAGASGFTLVELLVVVAILGVLATIGFPISAAMQQRARVAKAQGDARALVAAVSQYSSHNGGMPASLTSLTQTSTNALGQTAGPFLAAVPSAPTGWAAYAYTTAADGSYTISASGDGQTVQVP